MQAQIALGRRSLQHLRKAQRTHSRELYERWRRTARESKLYLCTLFVLADGKCPRCGVDMYIDFMGSDNGNKATLDHIDALSRTMEHDKLNLQIMCRKCNTQKPNITKT